MTMDMNKRDCRGGVVMMTGAVVMLMVVSSLPVTSSFVTPIAPHNTQQHHRQVIATQPPVAAPPSLLSQYHHKHQQRRRRGRRTGSSSPGKDAQSLLCLHGVRSRISQTFTRWKRTTTTTTENPSTNDTLRTTNNYDDNNSPITMSSSNSSILSSSDSSSSSLQTSTTALTTTGGEKNNMPKQLGYTSSMATIAPIMATTTATTTITIDEESSIAADTDATADADTSTSLYSLPPVNRSSMTALELEFRDMLEHFTNYTQHDILSLKDAKMRTLIEGIAASAHDQAVYRAFEVLFEDLYPLRVAGRVIYSRLVDLMEKSNQERQAQVQAVAETTGMTVQDVDAARLLFVTAASALNNGPYITLEQLQTTGLVDTARSVLTYESADRLLQLMDPKKTGRVQFTDFILGLQQAAQEQCAIEDCNPIQTLHEIVTDLKDNPPNTYNVEVDVRRKKFVQRYDEMLYAFVQWQDLLPAPEQQQGSPLAVPSRRWDVIHGCFVGAANEKVVAALRVCYVEYSGLRLAAEIIFKLVSAFMNGRQRSQQRPSS